MNQLVNKCRFIFVVFLLSLYISANGQIRVEPMCWWTGMKNPNLQLMVNAKDVASAKAEIKYDGVILKDAMLGDSPNYQFLNLEIQPNAKVGKFPINFVKDKKVVYTFEYELKARRAGSAERMGLNPSDLIYLIVPDRFANGDPSNDSAPDMFEKGNRALLDGGRHGGDIKGMTSKLDYIKDLGATSIWPTPLLENNMERYSYHGYGITDFYRVDPRFGTMSDYLNYIETAHQKGLKVIQDMVFNHCGGNHWWMKDLPMKDWLNSPEKFGNTNYRGFTKLDIHASDYDKNKMERGWFVTEMPDLNQHNKFLATYLIQNSIWWIEYANLDGIRMDTHMYAFSDVMAEWGKLLYNEYPNFFFVSEIWLTKPSMVAYYQKDAKTFDGYNGYQRALFDFPMQDALIYAFNEETGWNKGIIRLYDILVEDFLYPSPENIVVFNDNHDVGRHFSTVGKDLKKYKLSTTFILTTRGIPLVYYGSEVCMNGEGVDGDGAKRKDMPGGWAGDKANAFTKEGLTDEQKECSNFFHKLMNWRKSEKVFNGGKLKQFIPENEVYVYFRYTADDAVMVILNNNPNEQKLDTQRFAEMLKDYKSATDVISDKKLDDLKTITISGRTPMILELKK